jgi:hypothetical protein
VVAFTGCGSGWQSTGNLITNTDLRFDSTQFGRPYYGSYSQAVSLVKRQLPFGGAKIIP